MNYKIIIMKSLSVLLLALFFISCSNNNKISDAFGNFEATELMVSAEAQGKVIDLKIERGQELKAGDVVGIIDTTQLVLKILQVKAQKSAISVQFSSIMAQVEVQEQQKNNLLTEKKRVENLLKDGAATSKQMDDINGQLNVIESSINSIKTQNPAVFSNIQAFDMQIAQIEDMLSKCKIINPIDGIVLEKYTEQFELATPGKPLYKIANLSNLELRVYISGKQLPHIKLGQTVEVLIDKNVDENSKLEGIVSWISPKAEFTPKIIQTKEERINLVYAVKVKVKNDGRLKIGMPGEVNFK